MRERGEREEGSGRMKRLFQIFSVIVMDANTFEILHAHEFKTTEVPFLPKDTLRYFPVYDVNIVDCSKPFRSHRLYWERIPHLITS